MWQVTEKRNIFISWLLWHYVVALQEIFSRWKDILRFNLDYFSIPFLFQTLFSPWRRYKISYGKGFDIGKFSEAIIFNAFSRFMGMITRTAVIFIGTVMQIFIVLLGAFLVLLWIFLPPIIIFGIFISLKWIILT